LFYLVNVDVWGGVDTVRYNGEIDYVPHAELERITHGKLADILRRAIGQKSTE
jgi:hypothetical protein